MSSAKPLKRELSRLDPISPEIDPILEKLYESLDDPTYRGNPVGMLTLISEIIGDHDSRLKLEQRFEEAEPDPGLFPEDTGFDTAALLTPEALNAKLGTSLNSSAYIRHMMDGDPVSRKLAQDPSFSEVLERIDSFLAKPLDSGAGAVAEGTAKEPRWTRRKLKPAKKQVDRKPKRLGPEGTWVNDPDDGEGDQTRTIVQGGRTITSLKRQDTLEA